MAKLNKASYEALSEGEAGDADEGGVTRAVMIGNTETDAGQEVCRIEPLRSTRWG